ncbi:GL11407 [Drosophila persimilis]|uniref:GL11407 n=1 Tax=Drosophila persimilis TaxID=7234 RepID=B4GAM4_DROPE|nr:GL11407 [Drosophila persimilis]
MQENCCNKDCLGLRKRVCGLHQTFKWLHQTPALHEYLISASSVAANTGKASEPRSNNSLKST